MCPACVFRRQALATAGIVEPDDTYKYDFIDSARGANKIPPKRLEFLKAFLKQVAWLKDIETRGKLPAAFVRNLISTEILGRDESQDDVVQLLTRYRDEWMEVASKNANEGHHWARLLGRHESNLEGRTYATA